MKDSLSAVYGEITLRGKNDVMKIVISILIIFLVLFVIGLYLKNKAVHPQNRGDLSDAIDKEIKKLIGDQKNFIISVGVYKQEKLFFKTFGKLENSTTVINEESVFQIGSLTKLFTTSIFMALVEKNVFKDDTRLSEILGEQYKLSPKVRDITLKQLATHTSGFPQMPKVLLNKVEEINPVDPLWDPYAHVSPEEIFAYLQNPVDIKAAGTVQYSNYGMGLLAHLMEIKTGKSFAELLEEFMTRPLEMNDTILLLAPDKEQKLVPGFSAEERSASVWNFKALAGAGALYSSANDMMKFIIANLQQKVSYLTKMQQADHGLVVGWMSPTVVDRFFGNTDILWHNGRVGAYSSYLSIDLKGKTGVVILSNRSIDITMLGVMLMRQVRTQSWN